MLSKLLKLIKVSTDNPRVEKICTVLDVLIIMLAVYGVYSLAIYVMNSAENTRNIEYHHERFLEQLPDDHPYKIKVNSYENRIKRLESKRDFIVNGIFYLGDELIKYYLGEIDITELGLLSAYTGHKFNESKPKFFIAVEGSNKTVKKLKIKLNENQTVKLYRNNQEVSFEYSENEPLLMYYIADPEIAKIKYNRITAVKKGSTKLIIVYRGCMLVCPIIVK